MPFPCYCLPRCSTCGYRRIRHRPAFHRSCVFRVDAPDHVSNVDHVACRATPPRCHSSWRRRLVVDASTGWPERECSDDARPEIGGFPSTEKNTQQDIGIRCAVPTRIGNGKQGTSVPTQLSRGPAGLARLRRQSEPVCVHCVLPAACRLNFCPPTRHVGYRIYLKADLTPLTSTCHVPGSATRF